MNLCVKIEDMIERILIDRFVKDRSNAGDPAVRVGYARLAAITGIACNCMLFLVKLMCGLYAHSASVVSDAFNNLSDSVSSIMALAGMRLAARPADKNHPFGHGRMEYIAGLAVCALILLAAFELCRKGIVGLFAPSRLRYSSAMLLILCLSVVVKLWLAHFNETISRATDNVSLHAAAIDARGDGLATCIAMGSMLLESRLPGIPFDSIASIVLSLLIAKSGIEAGKDMLDRLIGSPCERDLYEQTLRVLENDEEVLGVHDLIIHSYGPLRHIASANVEINGTFSFNKAHGILDRLERLAKEQLNVDMTLHGDPVNLDDAERERDKKIVEDIFAHMGNGIPIHDFRRDATESMVMVSFDAVLPYGFAIDQEKLEKTIIDALGEKQPVSLRIVFDHDLAK